MVSHTENINTIKIDYTQKRKEIKKKMIFLDVRNYIREYNDTTGIQGLHYLTDNKRSSTEKIVWGIILLTSLTGCFWMIYEILQKYLNSPIVIGFANEPGLIHQIPFPAVTICPLNTVSNHKFNYENIKLKLKNITSLTAEERRILYYMRSICSKSASLYKEELNCMLNNEGILDVIEKVAPDPPLVACHFGNEKYNCADIFTRVLTNSGICYSFNVMDRNEVFKNQVFHYKDFHQVGRNSSAFDGESGYKGKIGPNVYPRRALFSRLTHGLYFGLVQRSKDINKFCDPILKGYLMMVHLPSETSASKSINVYSLPLEESLILSITPELTRTSDKIKKFNVEKRKCYLKGEKQLKYYQIYTKSNCETECLTNITLSKCGCVPFYMPRMNGTEFICSLERHNCIDEAENIDVTAHLAGFFGDGYETSSIVMSFVLYEIAANPHLQTKLRQEIKEAFELNNNKLSYETLQELPCLDSVINEAMRIHPPVFSLLRVCTNQFALLSDMDNTAKPLIIEQGTPIVLPIFGLQYDPQYFEVPETFKPERFLGANKENINKYTYLPLGVDGRNCLGQSFGILKIKTGIVYSLKNYELVFNKKRRIPIEYDPSYFLASLLGGIWLDFNKIF